MHGLEVGSPRRSRIVHRGLHPWSSTLRRISWWVLLEAGGTAGDDVDGGEEHANRTGAGTVALLVVHETRRQG